MLLVPTYLARSPIHGMGVFCQTLIPAHEPVWQWHPEVDRFFSFDVVNEFPEAMKEFLIHFGYIDFARPTGYSLDGDNCRFMNHAWHFNVDFSRDHKVGFAAQDIQPNEELVCNYCQYYTEAHLSRIGVLGSRL